MIQKGVPSVFVGSGQKGNTDGVDKSASFSIPWGITLDQQTGNLFVCDYGNHNIRKITPQGILIFVFVFNYSFYFVSLCFFSFSLTFMFFLF
jgi:DNA-binding beta-propeller fold protein YncE